MIKCKVINCVNNEHGVCKFTEASITVNGVCLHYCINNGTCGSNGHK